MHTLIYITTVCCYPQSALMHTQPASKVQQTITYSINMLINNLVYKTAENVKILLVFPEPNVKWKYIVFAIISDRVKQPIVAIMKSWSMEVLGIFSQRTQMFKLTIQRASEYFGKILIDCEAIWFQCIKLRYETNPLLKKVTAVKVVYSTFEFNFKSKTHICRL